jgi:hypothetical protein
MNLRIGYETIYRLPQHTLEGHDQGPLSQPTIRSRRICIRLLRVVEFF